jgi:NADPH-dependent 2,4-dienoyl-CoA reductase/sulfur reductase-like enzyme/nitrite reductase/ring-hydroxylating ferredoxin subunit
MGGQDKAPAGPDFRDGIDLSQLHEGVPLAGHAGDDAVLLTRIGNDVFAIGASCTHYSGPLGEGLVEGDTVRCPWHHACFNLRTGEALKAPALSPLPRWSVERDGNRVRVGEKIQQEPLARSSAYSASVTPKAIVIVGMGAAGSAAIEMLRRAGYAGQITAIDPDPDAPYDRPNLSKDYLAGNAPEDWIPIRPPRFYEDHGVTVVRAGVKAIHPATKTVEVEGQPAIAFDALLLATGAEPIVLPIPGHDLPHVHTLRSLADSRRIIRGMEGKHTAVVIGASFIGLEVAASLRARKLDVHVVAPESIPLERILGTALGEFVRDLHATNGVTFHLGRKPSAIEQGAVVLDDGTRIPAEIVVAGVGVRPRLAIAEAAGLTMDRGVIVNERLETSASGIYAAGDIARFPDARTGEPVRIEHWVVAQRMGQVAARNMLGAGERFTETPFFWSAHYDATINYVGHAEKPDRVTVDGSAQERNVAVRYESNDGRLMALATIFRDDESLRVAADIEHEAEARVP